MLKYNSNNKNIPTTELILNIEAFKTVLLHEDKLKKKSTFWMNWFLIGF